MTALFTVTTPAADRKLTTNARARSDLNLPATDYDDAFVDQMIESASAAIVSYLNIASDGEHDATLGAEAIEEIFRPCTQPLDALSFSRAPIIDIDRVDEDGAVWSRLLAGNDGAVDVNVDATTFTSAGGPDGGGFLATHVGQAIVIAGAGAAGADHATTIAAVIDPQTVTLADAALTTVVAAAGFTVVNPTAAPYEWRRNAGLLHKVAGGARLLWTARKIVVSYRAGWTLPGAQAGRNLPIDIEDACILLIRRKIDQVRECENPRVKSESWAGVGSWTFDLSSIEWTNGVTSDVAAMLQRYKRRVV